MTNLVITEAAVALLTSPEDADILTAPANEAVTAGDYVRLDTTTGKITHGNGSSSTEARKGGVAITSASAAGMPVTMVRKGLVDLGDALSALTYDDDVYLSDTDGKLADAAGTTSLIVGTVEPVWGSTTPGKALRIDL